MRRTAGFVLLSLAVAGLGACGSGRPILYYTLEFPPAPQPSTSVYPITILVGRLGAPDLLQDEPIIYRTGPNEIGTYAYHHWAEPPARMIRVMLFRRLRSSGKYQSVSELGSAARGDYVLQGRLDDFEEVDTAAGIAALVTMELELVDRKTNKTVWSHVYSRSEPVPGKQIPDVVAALNGNLRQGLDEILSSLDAYFSANLKD
jgi:cholesterol transport system auxiliary component